jgi:hypothetical protein
MYSLPDDFDIPLHCTAGSQITFVSIKVERLIRDKTLDFLYGIDDIKKP